MKVASIKYTCPVIRSPQWTYFRISNLSPLIHGASCKTDDVELVIGISNYTNTKRVNTHVDIDQRYVIVYDGVKGFSILDTMVNDTGDLQNDIKNVIRRMGGFSNVGYEIEMIA